jgi:SAM-dependent methyltransferase
VALIEAVRSTTIRYVLDVGCGAGQELWPLISQTQGMGIGIDVSPEVGTTGRNLFSAHAPRARVAFVRGAAERLPFPSGCFDAVICRLVLPYTDNSQSLSEMSRVLREGGVLLLKVHRAAFYAAQLMNAVIRCRPRGIMYHSRVLLVGAIYILTGRQLSVCSKPAETFQSIGKLKRQLAVLGLNIRAVMPDTNPRTPSFVIVKRVNRSVMANRGGTTASQATVLR